MADETNPTRAQLKKLAHDLRNHIFVLDMGLSSLEFRGEGGDEVAKLMSPLRTELKGLAQIADALDALSQPDC
jgi:hypothetical protein